MHGETVLESGVVLLLGLGVQLERKVEETLLGQIVGLEEGERVREWLQNEEEVFLSDIVTHPLLASDSAGRLHIVCEQDVLAYQSRGSNDREHLGLLDRGVLEVLVDIAEVLRERQVLRGRDLHFP